MESTVAVVQSEEELRIGLDALELDAEMRQYMCAAEKNSQKIKSGRMPFSPEASTWIRRAQVHRSLPRLHAGQIRKIGSLERATRRCGIEKPMKKSLAEIRARLKVCKEKCNFFKNHGHKCRRRHLRTMLVRAWQERDAEAEARILCIIQREKDRPYLCSCL